MDVHFQFLDLPLTLRARSDCTRPLGYAYGAFAQERDEPASACVEWSAEGVRTDRGSFPAIAGLPPLTQLYPRLLDRLYDGLGNHALLHAAVVERDGEAILLAAPSGHGKSTLALELACRGWTLFSDDFAPLSLADGRVSPFPRAVGIVPDSTATPAPFARAAKQAKHRLFGKSLVDPADHVSTAHVDAEPLPVRHVFLLEGDGVASPRLELSFAPAEETRLEQRLEETPGADVVRRDESPTLVTWALETKPGSGAGGALEALATDPAVLFSVKYWSRRTRWGGAPKRTPMLRREAAQQLSRELLNRRPGGALMARYDGDALALMIDLGGFLKQAECWRLEPGDLGKTAASIEKIVEASS